MLGFGSTFVSKPPFFIWPLKITPLCHAHTTVSVALTTQVLLWYYTNCRIVCVIFLSHVIGILMSALNLKDSYFNNINFSTSNVVHLCIFSDQMKTLPDKVIVVKNIALK